MNPQRAMVATNVRLYVAIASPVARKIGSASHPIARFGSLSANEAGSG